jgi:AcrR family transcriptional regulator
MVKKSDRPHHIIKTTLGLAATGHWTSSGLRDIAEAADVSLAELHTLYPSKTAILKAYFDSVDASVIGTKFVFGEEDGPRDRLFDVLMRRFDTLSEDRDGVIAILDALRRDPITALCLSSGLPGSMRWMLETGGIKATGLSGRLIVKGLSAVWLATLRVWMSDDSEDMARTMSALDKNLHRAGRIYSFLPTGRQNRRPAEPEQNVAPA